MRPRIVMNGVPRSLAMVMAGGLLLVACNGGGSDDPTQPDTTFLPIPTERATPSETTSSTPTTTPTPSLTPAPTTTPTPTPDATTTTDPSALADVAEDGEVTIEEAQAILDAHLAIYNPTVVDLLTTPDEDLPPLAPPQMVDALFAVYTEADLNFHSDGWNQALNAGLPGFQRQDASGFEETVIEVVAFDENCIQVRVEVDSSGVVENPGTFEPSYFELLRDPQDPPRNETEWVRNYQALEPPPDVISCL